MDLNPDLLDYQTISEKTIVSLHNQLMIARKALAKIAEYDIEKETGYNDTLEKANSFHKLKRIAQETLDTLG